MAVGGRELPGVALADGGPALHLALDYGIDAPWFSVGLRARGARAGIEPVVHEVWYCD